ncbi:MAG: glycosyltransferase family 2 protein [Candidatus Jordarchaeaceae archaeon]
MKISIIIPTRNRPKSLERLLLSILVQKTLPDEIIVVDDSDDLKTKRLIDRLGKFSVEKKVKIRYFRRKRNATPNRVSISHARNVGSKKAKGDIVCFLDDDIVLRGNYLREIMYVFEKYPSALGVQGFIINESYSHFWNSVRKVFYYWHAEPNRCRVLPSGKTTHACAPAEIIPCEWLVGGITAYKKEVFKEFSFNEKLLGYSLGEDKEFSYRVYRKYPRSLFLTPFAQAYHYPPPSKDISKCKILTIIAYPIGFFYNNIEQTLKNKIIFIWSEIGRLFLNIIWSLPSITAIKQILDSYTCTIKHFKDIKNENYQFIFDMDVEE